MFSKIILRDFSIPLAERLKRHKISCTGPYYLLPLAKPGDSVGFYMVNGGTDTHDSMFRLRIEKTGGSGWYRNDYGETYDPIIARLPRSRGFLAGATMGEHMASFLNRTIYTDESDARAAADSEAEYAAERQREHEEEEDRCIRAEQLEAENRDLIRQVRLACIERRRATRARIHAEFPRLYLLIRKGISDMLRTIEANTVRLTELEG